jgi:hypothetical protein
MVIPYKKQYVKSDGRKLNRSGPRDMQARTAGSYTPDTDIVGLLTNQLTELKAEILAMKSRSGEAVPAGFFSPEQVDDEIRKAVESAVAEAAVSFKGAAGKNSVLAMKEKIAKLEAELGDVAELKKQIAVLEQELEGKRELIETLKTRPAIINGEIITDPDRPQMEQVFIDPLEKNAGEGMKASIQVETIVKDEEVGEKVNKLKDLLGKLPNK